MPPTVDQLAGALQPPGPEEQADLAQRWRWVDDDGRGIPPFAITSATTAQQAAVDQQPGADEQFDHTLRWFAVERDPVLGRPPLPSAAMHPDFGWDRQQDRDLSIRWYQEPDASLGIPPFAITSATAAQQAGLWIEQPGQERPDRVVWFGPDAEIGYVGPPLGAVTLTPTPQGDDPQSWQVWGRPPDESADAPFQSPILTGWLVEDVLAAPPAWQPSLDLSAEPLLVVPSAALWADGSGQQDRAIQPVWWAPDNAFEGLVPPLAVIIGGIPPGVGGLNPMAFAQSSLALPGAGSDIGISGGKADASLSSGRSDSQAPSGTADGSTPSGSARSS